MKVEHPIMTPLAPVTGDQTFRELKQSLEETSTQLGELPNFIRVLARSPAALKAYTLVDKALANGQITPRQREQIALAVAEINSCSYSLSVHCALGLNLGLSEEDIRLARKATASDPQTKAMLRFTQAVVLQRGGISRDELQMLRAAGFRDAQIIEILAGVGLNIFTNYFNTVAKTQADFPLITPEVEIPCPPIKPGERK